MQLFGYQAFRYPNCSTAIESGTLWGAASSNNEALFKLYKWTGNGPYGGFSICRNITQNFSPYTNQVSNKFVNYNNAPCGAGMYAASICSTWNMSMFSVLNGQVHATDMHASADCENSPYQQWLWTNDWHYFA